MKQQMNLEAARLSWYGVSIDLPRWRAALYKCTSTKTAQEKVLATISIQLSLPRPPASAWKRLSATPASLARKFPLIRTWTWTWTCSSPRQQHSFSFFCARSQRSSLCCSFSPFTRSKALTHQGRSTFLGLEKCSLLGPCWAPRSNFRSSIRSASLPKPYGSWWIVNNVMPPFRIRIRAVH